MKTKHPPFLYRQDDGIAFRRNDDGTYSLAATMQPMPGYSYDHLVRIGFTSVKPTHRAQTLTQIRRASLALFTVEDLPTLMAIVQGEQVSDDELTRLERRIRA